MKVTVNIEEAKNAFRSLAINILENSWQPQSIHKDLIKNIILGSHLTYRYILITATLAKYINNQINPLTLQASSSLEGAYDARTLCHKVIVPIEREVLGGRLGASNEPFLNKPARFKELSLDNAVRAGRDKETLNQVLTILSSFNTSLDAEQALMDIIYYILQRENHTNIYDLINNSADIELANTFIIIKRFLKKSFEGQVAVLVTAASLKILFEKNLIMPKFKVHPINQSGASSNEILDIDIFDAEKSIISVEVKDKTFTSYDIEHTVKKAMLSGQNKLLFVIGSHVMIEKNFLEKMEETWLKREFFLNFINILDLVKISLSLPITNTHDTFITNIFEFAKLARVKDGIIRHLDECLKK